MTKRIFISAASREFGIVRGEIADRLRSRGVRALVQSAFAQGDDTTLAKLHDYIKGCDRVLAIVGEYSGAYPPQGAVTDAFRAMLPAGMARASYTQWEVIFARHYGIPTFFFESAGFAPERERAERDDAEAQAAWRDFLFDGEWGRDRRQFATADGLRADVMELDWPRAGKPCTLPGSIGHLFKGRDDFLDRITQSFKDKDAAAIVGTAMHGLGGVGKTRAAVEYAHAHQDDYSALFFLIGKSPSDLQDELAKLCGVLELEQQNAPDLGVRVAAVIRWLKANPGWLLVIDNVDDEPAAQAVQQFLDQVALGKGHVLITSRMAEWGFGVEPLQLDLLSLDAAMDLLREATPNRTRSPDEDAALERLAQDQLGCLSLALAQAAAYIQTRRISFARYSQDFDKQAATLLAKFGPADGRKLAYPMAVAQTWLTSFEQLGPEARLLLDMLAWLSIEPIPRSLWDVWPQAEECDLEEGLADLSRYSFVSWEEGNTAITVHRLVQEVARDLQQRDEAMLEQTMTMLFGWLIASNPELNAGDVRCWPVLLPLLPHALRLFERTQQMGPYPAQTSLYDEYATLLQALARYAEAEPLYRRALAIDEAQYGPDDPNLSIRLNNLAALLQATARLDEAEPLYRRALAIGIAHCGPDHPEVAIRLNNLAALLWDSERLEEAEPLLRQALAIDEASLGPDHSNVAIRLNNLAAVLRGSKRLEEAEPLYRRALGINEANYGPDHPEVATILSNLCGLLEDTDRLADAERLHRRSALILLRASKRSGRLLPDLRTCLRNFVHCLIELGHPPQQIGQTIGQLMIEGGFDPAELGPQIFGNDDANSGAPGDGGDAG